VIYSEVKSDWMDKFWVKFLGSVQVPYHKGNDVLCAAMHKVYYFISGFAYIYIIISCYVVVHV